MTDQLDPNKYHVMTSSKKIILGIFLVIMTLVVLPLVSFSYYSMAINRPSQTDREITFEIRRGMSMPEIAKALYEEGAINSDFLFNLYIFLNKFDRNIQAGVYVIPAGTSVVELAQMFQSGKLDVQITFLEGWRLEEYAREASSIYENIDYKKFMDLARPYEGYLFPDTYIFNKEVEEEEMIEHLMNTFEKKTEDSLTSQNLDAAGLTKEQVVILASIVEKEALGDEDRPVIAGILLKRWNEGMQLDADATVQYAVAITQLCPITEEVTDVICAPPLEELFELDWWPNDLTQKDLETQSSYNTRLYVGFPPAPISSVGIASLNAVLNAERTEYYYYLHDNKGNAHYAVTLEEHNQNIEQYLR